MPFDNTPAEIVVDTPASVILEAAIKLIERPECWCKGAASTFRSNGSVAYCVWGAVVETLGDAPRPGEDFDRAAKALHAIARAQGYMDIAKLNDDPSVTHAMVIEVMREAVEIARGTP